jgi:glutamate racemase
MKLNYALALSLALFVSACKQNKNTADFKLDPNGETYAIEKEILTNDSSFYYIDTKNYFANEVKEDLAIGVFDSGTGGLTVLDALVRYDKNNNATTNDGTDGQPDFSKENFIYLADQANMPYGNYFKAGKTDLLKEHIVKDVQFLLGQKYYITPIDATFQTNKQKVKAIVIACNTATAYGQLNVDEFMAKTGLNIPVIGVINAGVRGTLQNLAKDENAAIGVFATVGTIASDGYGKTIKNMAKDLGYTGQLQVFNQGGHGVAEAVDGEPDYINTKSNAPRADYRGPSLTNEDYKIDKTLLDIYNFNFDKGKMLCDAKNGADCNVLQINDTENYVRYHLVSLMEQIRKSSNPQQLKALILGCTHYPYLTKQIEKVFDELYQYKGQDGKFVYRDLMAAKIKLIDPAEYVAKELYEALKKENHLNKKGDMLKNSEFFISVPNLNNKGVQTEENGSRLTYDYKYGRNAGEIQEYVKVVPFNKTNISTSTAERLKSAIPTTFEMIKNFNQHNQKMSTIESKNRLN